MRIYLAGTIPGLERLWTSRATDPEHLTAYTVTPALRDEYPDGDEEELEYLALRDAAQASVALLAADPAAPRRRVVLAAEVPDEVAASPPEPARRSEVLLRTLPVPLEMVAAVHVDDPAAEKVVEAAVLALPAATADAEDEELLWFATQEVPELLRHV